MTPVTETQWIREQIAVFEARLVGLGADPRPEIAIDAPAVPSPERRPPPPPSPVAPTRRSDLTLPAVESLLKWSGLGLLFLAAVFLVSTAIERGWIGPELQLLGAAAIGAALIGTGLVVGPKRVGWDVPLVSVGIAVLSACATAGWSWLEIGDASSWIPVSFIVLGLSVPLTNKLRSPGVGAVALCSTVVSMLVLASSIGEAAVLTAAALAISVATSVATRLPSLDVIGSVTSIITFGSLTVAAVLTGSFDDRALVVGGGAVVLILSIAPIGFALRGLAESPSGVNWIPTVQRVPIALPGLFALGCAMAYDLSDLDSGRIFLAAGTLALVAGAVAHGSARFEQALWVSYLLGGAVAVSVGSALTLEGPALLVGLVAQSGALMAFVHFVDDRWARFQAAAMSTGAGVLALSSIVAGISDDPPLIDDLVHLGVIVLGAAWAWKETKPEFRLVLAGATFTGVVLWPLSALSHLPQGQALVSATWAALGLGLVAAGFVRTSMAGARTGLIVLAVVVAKLVTVDLAAVDTFWRVLLFFVLGGAFLASSYRAGTAITELSVRSRRTDHDHDAPLVN